MKKPILFVIILCINFMYSQSQLAANPTKIEVPNSISTTTPPIYPGCNSDKIDQNTCTFNLFNKDFNTFLQLSNEDKPECETQVMSLVLNVDTESNLSVKEIKGDITEKYKTLVTEKIPEFGNYLKSQSKTLFPATSTNGFINSTIQVPFVIHSKGYHEYETFTKNDTSYKTFLNCSNYYVYNLSNDIEFVEIFHTEAEYSDFKNQNSILLNSENLKLANADKNVIKSVKEVEKTKEKITQLELEQQKLNETKEEAIQEAIKAKEEALKQQEVELIKEENLKILKEQELQKKLEQETIKAKIKELKESLKEVK